MPLAWLALWAPQIGKFGSLLKYYQEMLSYLSPPIVAAFLLGIFNRRVNGNGVFVGLLGGLVIAVSLLFFKSYVFGNLHFLLIVPFLLVVSGLLMYVASRFSAAPLPEKLENTVFSWKDMAAEFRAHRGRPWYEYYLWWALLLLLLSAVIWIVFS